MKNSSLSIFQKLFKFLFLSYVAILPMSHSIALRNLLLLVLVFFVLFYAGIKRNQLNLTLTNAPHQIPIIVLAWFIFLFLFPLWAVQTDVAWVNLKGQWIESIFSWIIGFGVILILGNRGPGLWALAFSSSFSIAVHLLLFTAAWAGILGSEYYENPSITSYLYNFVFQNRLNLQPFPMGFLGVEPMHGNLGYAACQSIALFSVCIGIALRERRILSIVGAIILILFCFLSLFILESRGAILYGLFIIITSSILFKCVIGSEKFEYSSVASKKIIGYTSALVVIAVVFLFVIAFQSIKNQERWYSMIDKVKVGLVSEYPVDILCEGVSPQVEKQVRELFSDHDPAYIQVLLDGLKQQDGGRILIMRAGAGFVLENPGGLDGSKQTFQKMIREKCGHEPVLGFSHAHQGWIDLALALGWSGALLLACLFMYFARVGWINMRKWESGPWAMALFLISFFWILRGFADSVFREHYLQMQAVILAYLFWKVRLGSVEDKNIKDIKPPRKDI